VLPRLRKRGVAPAKKTGCCPGYAREVLPILADIWLRRRGVASRSKNSKESTKFHRVGGSAQHINIPGDMFGIASIYCGIFQNENFRKFLVDFPNYFWRWPPWWWSAEAS